MKSELNVWCFASVIAQFWMWNKVSTSRTSLGWNNECLSILCHWYACCSHWLPVFVDPSRIAIKHRVPDRIKLPFVTLDHSDAQGWASECPDVKNYKWQLNPVWHRILYSCTHIATAGVKGLITSCVFVYHLDSWQLKLIAPGRNCHTKQH